MQFQSLQPSPALSIARFSDIDVFRPLEFAAQIADFISIKLTGVATRFGQSTVAPMKGCRGRRPLSGDLALEEGFSVVDFIGPPRIVGR